MPIVNGRSDFEEQSFSKKTSISKGTDIFSLGGDYFTIKTNLENRVVRDISAHTGDFSQPITLEDIDVSSEKIITYNEENALDLNFDKSELTNYAYFGSLNDKFKFSILNIISKFPASLFVNDTYNDVLRTILSYSYDILLNQSTITIPISAITNNFNLKITQTSDSINTLLSDEDLFKDLFVSFEKYELWDFQNTFDILNFTSVDSGNILLTVVGNPFPQYSSTNTRINFHIKPKGEFYNDFMLNLSDLEKYLLSKDTLPKYTSTFKVLHGDANGNPILIDETFTWKTTDGYNIDYNTYEFEIYSEKLLALGQSYDDYKTNIIARQLISAPVIEFDSEDQRMDKLLKLYGAEFDEIKKYIDGLAHLTRVTYDKKDNIPDRLIKNFARTLGWGTFSTVDEDSLMKSFLSDDSNVELAGESKNMSPVETDIELWRRLVMNSAYLFKSKTTRSCIEFLFKLIGAPASLIDIQEYVYVADSKVTVADNYGLPIDDEGYPIPMSSDDHYFQMKGGWNTKREIAPTNSKNYNSVVGIHTGDYDGGNSYIDKFTQAGFKLKRIVDNRKTWANVDGGISDDIKDSRLVINSKEITIYLSPFAYQDSLVLNYQKLLTNDTLLHTIDDVYTSLIDPTTRKVIDHNGGYPKLKKLFYNYLKSDGAINPQIITTYLQQINGFWLDLLEQFVPSTAIWQGGTVYKNTIFDRQKHIYKVGVNFGSEFEKEVNDFPSVQLQPVQIQADYNPPLEFTASAYEVDVTYVSTLEFPDADSHMVSNSNVLRVKTDIESNTASFQLPAVEVEGGSKIDDNASQSDYQTLVANGGGVKTMTFIFDNSELFQDDTTFVYKIYKLDETTKTFNPTAVISKSFEMGVYKTNNVPLVEQITLSEGDYLLKCGFNVEVRLDSSQNTIKDHYTVLTDNGVDSLINVDGGRYFFNTLMVSETNKYGIYNNNDWWFTVVEAPSTPMIKNLYEKSAFTSAQLVNQELYVSADNQKIFVLEVVPEGDIFFNINGSTLIQSSKRDYSDGGEYYLYREGDSCQIILNEGIDISKTDIISVIYLKANSDISFVNTGVIRKSDPKLIETQSNGSFIYSYNFEYSLKTEVSLTEMIVILNGQKLLKSDGVNVDFDYGIDPLDETKLLIYLSNQLVESNDETDELIIYYPKPLEDGLYIQDKAVHVSWTSDNTTDEGTFTAEIATDRAFNDVVLSAVEPFTSNANIGYTEYNIYVGDVVVPYATYYYRIKSEKINKDLLGRTATTVSYSTILTFKTDSTINI